MLIEIYYCVHLNALIEMYSCVHLNVFTCDMRTQKCTERDTFKTNWGQESEAIRGQLGILIISNKKYFR